jgi:hypothetical protein
MSAPPTAAARGARASAESLGPGSFCRTIKNLRVCGGRRPGGAPPEPPFLRGLTFARCSAVDLARPLARGLTVAGQRRIQTGLRRHDTRRASMGPGDPSIRHPAKPVPAHDRPADGWDAAQARCLEQRYAATSSDAPQRAPACDSLRPLYPPDLRGTADPTATATAYGLRSRLRTVRRRFASAAGGTPIKEEVGKC